MAEPPTQDGGMKTVNKIYDMEPLTSSSKWTMFTWQRQDREEEDDPLNMLKE